MLNQARSSYFKVTNRPKRCVPGRSMREFLGEHLNGLLEDDDFLAQITAFVRERITVMLHFEHLTSLKDSIIRLSGRVEAPDDWTMHRISAGKGNVLYYHLLDNLKILKPEDWFEAEVLPELSPEWQLKYARRDKVKVRPEAPKEPVVKMRGKEHRKEPLDYVLVYERVNNIPNPGHHPTITEEDVRAYIRKKMARERGEAELARKQAKPVPRQRFDSDLDFEEDDRFARYLARKK